MAVQTIGIQFQPLMTGFQAARRGLWWQRGIRTAARGVCLGLALALVAALLAGWQAPEPVRHWFWVAAGAAAVAGLVTALLTPPSVSVAARAVDLRLDLAQQLGTAEELLSKGLTGRIVTLQIAKASTVAEDLDVSRAFPLLPKRELMVAAALAACTGLLMLLVSLGIVLPNPLLAIHLPSPFHGTSRSVAQDVLNRQPKADPLKKGSPALDPVRQRLDDVQKKALQGALSRQTVSAALAQASTELNRVASDSRMQQRALDNLTNELKATAAGREAADSLRQGDYDRAAQQLEQIGQQSDQLSAAAKQQLAQALDKAARESPGAKELAGSESDAASSLRRSDYASVVQSMSQLAGAVKDAARETVTQSELADSWKRLEELNEQFGDPSLQGGSQGATLAPPAAQGGAGEQAGGQQATAPSAAQGGQPGALGQGQGQGNLAGAGGQPGNGSGGSPLGQQNPRPGPDGKQLDVEGQIGDRFPGQGAPGSQPPSVLRQGTSSANDAPTSSDPSGPTSVPAEKVFVPGDRRSTVRDYFSGGSGGQ